MAHPTLSVHCRETLAADFSCEIHNMVFKYFITSSRQLEVSSYNMLQDTTLAPQKWVLLNTWYNFPHYESHWFSLIQLTHQAGGVAGQRKQILALYNSTMKVISHILALII